MQKHGHLESPKIKLEPLDPSGDVDQILTQNLPSSYIELDEDDMVVSIPSFANEEPKKETHELEPPIVSSIQSSLLPQEQTIPSSNVVLPPSLIESNSETIEPSKLKSNEILLPNAEVSTEGEKTKTDVESNAKTAYVFLPCLVKICGVHGSSEGPKNKLEEMGIKNEIVLKLHDVREVSIERPEDLMFLCTYLSYPRGNENLSIQCSDDMKNKSPESKTRMKEKWFFTFWASPDWWRSLLENSFCGEGGGSCGSKMFLSQRMIMDDNEDNWIDWDENEVVFFPQENAAFEKFVSPLPPDEELTVPSWATDLAGTNFSATKKESKLRRELIPALPCSNYYNSLDGLFQYAVDKVSAQQVEALMEQRILRIGEFSGPKALGVVRATLKVMRSDPITRAYIIGDRKTPQGRTRIFPPRKVSFLTNGIEDEESEQNGILSSQDMEDQGNDASDSVESNPTSVGLPSDQEDPVTAKVKSWVTSNRKKMISTSPGSLVANPSTSSKPNEAKRSSPKEAKGKKQKVQKLIEMDATLENQRNDGTEKLHSQKNQEQADQRSINDRQMTEKLQFTPQQQESRVSSPKEVYLSTPQIRTPDVPRTPLITKISDGKNSKPDSPLPSPRFLPDSGRSYLPMFSPDVSKGDKSNEFGSFDPSDMINRYLK